MIRQSGMGMAAEPPVSSTGLINSSIRHRQELVLHSEQEGALALSVYLGATAAELDVRVAAVEVVYYPAAFPESAEAVQCVDTGVAWCAQITDLLPERDYRFRAYAYDTCDDRIGSRVVYYGEHPPVTVRAGENQPISILTAPGSGAVVFYDRLADGTVAGLHPNGWRHLEAAPSDACTEGSVLHRWAAWGSDIASAEATELGAGAANTAAIAVVHSLAPEEADTAAAAATYALNGYRDWFLPSKDELSAMYARRDLIGGFMPGYYWSSSQHDAETAWVQLFVDGYQCTNTKRAFSRVRAIRAV